MRKVISRVVTDVTMMVSDITTDNQIKIAHRQLAANCMGVTVLGGTDEGGAEILSVTIREDLTTSDEPASN